MDFESFLFSWEGFIGKIASSKATWQVPKEDLIQEGRTALWKIWKKYGADHPDIAHIVRHAMPNVMDRAVGSIKFPETVSWDGVVDVIVEPSLPFTPDKALSAREREIICLRGLKGFTTQEIAEFLGISPATVRQYWSRAHKKLKA